MSGWAFAFGKFTHRPEPVHADTSVVVVAPTAWAFREATRHTPPDRTPYAVVYPQDIRNLRGCQIERLIFLPGWESGPIYADPLRDDLLNLLHGRVTSTRPSRP